MEERPLEPREMIRGMDDDTRVLTLGVIYNKTGVMAAQFGASLEFLEESLWGAVDAGKLSPEKVRTVITRTSVLRASIKLLAEASMLAVDEIAHCAGVKVDMGGNVEPDTNPDPTSRTITDDDAPIDLSSQRSHFIH